MVFLKRFLRFVILGLKQAMSRKAGGHPKI